MLLSKSRLTTATIWLMNGNTQIRIDGVKDVLVKKIKD